MARPALTTLIAATAGATVFSWGITAQPVSAAVVTYDFEIDVPTGTYVGKYTGSFSYDDAIPLASGENCDPMKPSLLCVTPSIHGLAIAFNFLGKNYTEQDDLDYNQSNQYPKLFFDMASGGLTFLGLSFVVAPPQPDFGFFINVNEFQIGNYSDPANSLHNPYDAGEKYASAITYTLRPAEPEPSPTPDPSPTPTPTPTFGPGPIPTPDPCASGSCTAVPEPSEIAGSGVALGLLGLGSWWMRRKRVTSRPVDKA